MTTIDTDYARLEAALSLREIAGYYLKSAEEAGNPTVWEARLRRAAKLEKEAAALEAASNSHGAQAEKGAARPVGSSDGPPAIAP